MTQSKRNRGASFHASHSRHCTNSHAEQQFVLDVMEIVDHLKEITIDRMVALRWQELNKQQSKRRTPRDK